jgi:hypothetical protein
LFGHEEEGPRALGLAGSQEKAGSCPNEMLSLYILCKNVGFNQNDISMKMGEWSVRMGNVFFTDRFLCTFILHYTNAG